MKTGLRVSCLMLLMCFIMMGYLAGCAGVQTVQPYELGKVTAETILYDARVLQNKGHISEDQFNQVRVVYDGLKQAQDIAIDARKALIAFNTTENQQKYQKAFKDVLNLSGKLISLAKAFGIMKGELP